MTEPNVVWLEDSTMDRLVRQIKDSQDFKVSDMAIDIARKMIQASGFTDVIEVSVEEFADKLYDAGIGKKIFPKVKRSCSMGFRTFREKRAISN